MDEDKDTRGEALMEHLTEHGPDDRATVFARAEEYGGRGLSLIQWLVFFPLDAAGAIIRPIEQINGETGFAEILLEEVRVPAFNRLGDDGAGWSICMTTAGFERGLTGC